MLGSGFLPKRFEDSRTGESGDPVPKGVQIAIGAVLVAGLLGWYGWSSLGGDDSYAYYQTLSEFLTESQQAPEAGPARVHGYVAAGSIERDVERRAVHFEVQESPPHAQSASTETTPRLRVQYASLETPDLFKDGAEVVVEGELAHGEAGPVFTATKVLAKCPSKFQAAAAEQAAF
jgi:cytochrome c-type biogenesis protein CcmE